MRSNRIVFILGLILASYSLRAAGSPAPAVRKSADGVELPPAFPERKFHAAVPYASIILGQKPEEVGRVFNAKKSSAILARHISQDLGCDWFVLNAEGADVVGLGLTDGRVSKAVLFYETVNQVRIDNMRKQLDAHADKAVKVELKPIPGDGKKQSLLLTFEVDRIEFYLATHILDAKIASGLRQHTWVEGMTDEQAVLVGDGPGKYAAIYAADGSTGKSADVGAGTVFADNGGGPGDIVIVIQARNKHDAREQAMKRHKNLKELNKISDGLDKPDAGK